MSYDFTPLFHSAIGFDRLARLADAAQQLASAPAFPPYNIERVAEDSYRLTLAVAGFAPDDIELTAQDGTLLIRGRAKADGGAANMLHRGIAGRSFERRFVLADHIVVEGADMAHGLLNVSLRRVVPEALKPRRIEISRGAPQAIEAKAA
jgi:molecular chaperone IbpA